MRRIVGIGGSLDASEPNDDVKAAMGELAWIDEVTTKVIPYYSLGESLAFNDKKLNAFPIATIHLCAESLNIVFKTADE